MASVRVDNEVAVRLNCSGMDNAERPTEHGDATGGTRQIIGEKLQTRKTLAASI